MLYYRAMPRRFAQALVLAVAVAVAAAAAAPAVAAEGAVDRAAAAVAAKGLVDGGAGRVARILDGDTLALADGALVRLVGIRAPKPPPEGPAGGRWPEAARDALAALVRGRAVRLGYGGRREDRHGRILAHLFRDDGLWVQGALLARGLARVYSFRDNRALVREMLAIEAEARAAGRGIWSDPAYAVRAPGPRLPRERFLIVEGRVRRAVERRGHLYLDFGDDWRRDFTVHIAPRDRASFRAAGLDGRALEGRTIRVRGWVKWRNGPMIDATHPEQIEPIRP